MLSPLWPHHRAGRETGPCDGPQPREVGQVGHPVPRGVGTLQRQPAPGTTLLRMPHCVARRPIAVTGGWLIAVPSHRLSTSPHTEHLLSSSFPLTQVR